MKLSADGRYKLYPDCANDATTGATVAIWNPATMEPHANYPDTAGFLAEYGSEIPEPEPIEPETQADWAAFRAQISLHPAYLRLATEPQNTALNTLLVSLFWRVGEAPELLPEVGAIWNAMAANLALTEAEIEALNAIATACHVPLQLDNRGMMVVQLD